MLCELESPKPWKTVKPVAEGRWDCSEPQMQTASLSLAYLLWACWELSAFKMPLKGKPLQLGQQRFVGFVKPAPV